MFAVCVTFTVRPEQLAAFLPLMHRQAQNSMTREAGCRRFDVLHDPERPSEVFLYELYDDEAAFQAHLESEHFIAFDRDVAEMVAAKTVTTYAQVAEAAAVR